MIEHTKKCEHEDFAHYRARETESFLGKNVRVKIGETQIVEGKLLSFADDGSFEVLDEGFIVHYCWPMLSVEEIE